LKFGNWGTPYPFEDWASHSLSHFEQLSFLMSLNPSSQSY